MNSLIPKGIGDGIRALIASLTPDERQGLLSDAFGYAAQQQAALAPAEAQAMDFSAFKKRFWRRYQQAIFDALLDEKLAQVAEYVLTEGASGISRLAVFAPPRHGKTTRISQMFPAWLYSKKPDLRTIIASYGTDLSERNSRAIRNLIMSPTYAEAFPQTRLNSTRVDMWDTTAGGSLIAGSVGSAIVGHGGQVIIIDDPVKSRAEAESPTFRQRAKDWYNNDLLSRLEEPGGVIVLMATRYHQDDLSGYLLNDEDADEWTVLSFPAIAEESDMLGRELGEALWPAKYPAHVLQKRRAKMGEYAWASLYQQRPQPKDSGLFDTALIKVLDTPPACVQVVRFFDLAVSKKSTADYSVGLLLGVTADEMYVVLDVWRRQLSPADVGANIKRLAEFDGRKVKIRLEAENSARVQLDYLLRDPDLRPYTLDIKSPGGDKYTRASPVAARCNAGRLAMVRANWNSAFIDELGLFPFVKNDDQTDALSGAYDMLENRYEGAKITYGNSPTSYEAYFGGSSDYGGIMTYERRMQLLGQKPMTIDEYNRRAGYDD